MVATEEYMTAQEVADHYRLPLQTIYGWRYKGTGPKAVKLGRHLRYRRSEIEGDRRTERRRCPSASLFSVLEIPAPVRLDDLAAPVFPPAVAEMRAKLKPLAGRRLLTPEALSQTASEQTGGLTDFGGTDFHEALSVLCEAYRESGVLSPMGKVATHTRLTKLLGNRLLLQAAIEQDPGIDEEVIDRPVFIVGLPRTGSTHLHNLISADGSVRTLPYWEAEQPVIAPWERGIVPDPRHGRAQTSLDFLNDAMPHFKRMHEMTYDHAAETIHLLEMTFVSATFETMSPVPAYRDWLKASDRTASYAYMRTLLQAMQRERGGTRWLNKSALDHEGLVPLVAAFPDATFVMTHRDPVAVLASLITMYAYVARMNLERVDPVAIGAYWTDRIEDFLRAAIRDGHVLPADRTMHVHFGDFMADHMGTVERIYALAGLELSDEGRASMVAYDDDHQRSRFGAVLYDLADFGLQADELRERFTFYTDHFGIHRA